MHYLGIDVHAAASVWCLLDHDGEQLETGRCDTNFSSLAELGSRLRARGSLIAGQEVGTQAYLVLDAFDQIGVPLRSFNAAHLRMIAASRKKSDRRDAYWIARSLQTGMTPHPVFLPTGQVRELRRLLSRRRVILRDRNRWVYRARATLRSVGRRTKPGTFYATRLIRELLEHPDGCDADVLETVGLAERMISILDEELQHVDAQLAAKTRTNEAVQRLQTIPGVGM